MIAAIGKKVEANTEAIQANREAIANLTKKGVGLTETDGRTN